MATMTFGCRSFYEALLAMDRLKAQEILMKSLLERSPLHVAEEIVAAALEEIGYAWERGDAALSQVYMSSRICEKLIDDILPPASPERLRQPEMAIAVIDDYHILGKRIVYSAIRAAGYELLDFGTIGASELHKKAVEHHVKVLFISTLMLSSALGIKVLIPGLRRSIRGIRIMVGGAPFRFDGELWKEVGADAMGRNASDALALIHNCAGGK